MKNLYPIARLALVMILGVSFNAKAQVYCGTTLSGNCQTSGAGNNYIGTVTTTGGVTNFTNTTMCPPYPQRYTYFSALGASAVKGNSFQISAYGGGGDAIYELYIDWNGDADFGDAGEYYPN